jgi:diacylglycerol kinase (ATP)
MTTRRAPTVIDSFNYAFEGIIHVLRTQRNMRIHLAVAFGVIVLAILVNVTKIELIALLISITFVLIAEMINSALESAIDIATTSFDPMAKLAKDIAAGAVLIATINALAVGYLVFANKVADRSADLLDRLRNAPAELTVVALVLTVIVVIATKAYTGRGTPLRGGLPSGHSAVAFAGWVAATYAAGDKHRFLISSIALIMAFLVAQTRVESGVHSPLEVTYGALLGATATLVVFQVFA